MTELTLNIEGIDPIDFFGVNNSRFNFIKKSFPTLRMVSRGNTIKAEGSESDIASFKHKVERMIDHIERYGKLNEDNIETIVQTEDNGKDKEKKEKELNNIIVYGNNGLVVRARTDNQLVLVKESEKNDVVFAIGPAGTGKTYTAVALAVRALKEKNVKKIILTRPAVEAGESLGFLPGDLKEKIDPYLRPLYDALDDMIPADKLTYYMENRVIEVAPLAFMRGRTLDHSFILLDEAQNCTDMQLKMFLTRIGANSKCIITGDPTQIDLPPKVKSGLNTALKILEHIEGISTIKLNESDVVRHRLVKEIIKAYENSMKAGQQMTQPIRETDFNFPQQTNVYHGKVRDVYTVGDKLIAIATDRISAFDHILPKPIPHKGAVLNQIAAHFLSATKDIVPNWLLATPHPNVSVGVKCEPVRIEMVIRGYLAGHAAREYKAGKRTLCGVSLPEGLKENDRLPSPIITPSTKAVEGHDEDISRENILKRKIVSEEVYVQMEKYTYVLFERGQKMANERGLILVDTKYEFGLTDGKVILIDEIHTPDSSRYFYLEGYSERQKKGEPQKQLSKEFVREWLIANGFQGKEGQQMPFMPDEFVTTISERYIELYELITGKKFVRDDSPDLLQSIQNSVLNYLKSL